MTRSPASRAVANLLDITPDLCIHVLQGFRPWINQNGGTTHAPGHHGHATVLIPSSTSPTYDQQRDRWKTEFFSPPALERASTRARGQCQVCLLRPRPEWTSSTHQRPAFLIKGSRTALMARVGQAGCRSRGASGTSKQTDEFAAVAQNHPQPGLRQVDNRVAWVTHRCSPITKTRRAIGSTSANARRCRSAHVPRYEWAMADMCAVRSGRLTTNGHSFTKGSLIDDRGGGGIAPVDCGARIRLQPTWMRQSRSKDRWYVNVGENIANRNATVRQHRISSSRQNAPGCGRVCWARRSVHVLKT